MGAATSLPNPLSQQQSHDATSPPYYIMMGLSGAGKTAILDRLKLGFYIAHHPSIFENIETIDYMSKRGQRVFNLWDITERGGRGLRVYESCRTLYQQDPQGIIFVVDSADHSHLSMELAAERLSTVLREVEDLTLLPLLVLANKQDSRYAMTVADVKDMLGLEELPQE
ncbi:P-loop containing nucleoside triphosphate hydrolase protein [Linnemannia elongata AG-77]|uniref:p-loop containing nucleoside triphosphate hydrolase protein n=1 Tax=Linnemannia elongata AG-77 TaxID=1314771 RepID=A0A197KE07_9FUNG|nr:P-loop containing nucleoside triphosphate hydrolase protein [Linnemannia elongata AG-77]